MEKDSSHKSDTKWNGKDEILLACNYAVQKALYRHKQLGESIIIVKNGKTVEVTPEDIEIDEAFLAKYAHKFGHIKPMIY